MYIFHCNYYITFILFLLLFQYQALENKEGSGDFELIGLRQNGESLRNSVKRDTKLAPIAEVRETENLEKREIRKKKVTQKKSTNKHLYEEKSLSILQQILDNVKEVLKNIKRNTSTEKSTTKTPSTSSTTKSPIKKPPRKPSKKPSKKPKPGKLPKRISQILNEINKLRTKHGAKKLNVDKELAKKAQKHADEYANQQTIPFYKGKSIKTLIYKTSIGDTFNPISAWNLGSIFIDFDNPDRIYYDFPFTLLIWRSTKKIGCGISENKSNSDILTVCLLYPGGNVRGQFKKNIRKARE